MSAIAYTPDLADRSKVAAALPGTRFVTRPEGLLEADDELVIADLGRPGVLAVIAGLSGRRVGFAAHVDRATLAAARAAGVEALPRSAFFSFAWLARES